MLFSTDSEDEEPELSDTLKMLDQQQAEALKTQRKRRWHEMPLSTRVYYMFMMCLFGFCCCFQTTRIYKNARRKNESLSQIHSKINHKRRQTLRQRQPQSVIGGCSHTSHNTIVDELCKNRRASTLFSVLNTGVSPGIATALKIAPATLVRANSSPEDSPTLNKRGRLIKKNKKPRSLRLPEKQKHKRKISAAAALQYNKPRLSITHLSRLSSKSPLNRSIYRNQRRLSSAIEKMVKEELQNSLIKEEVLSSTCSDEENGT